MHSRGFTLVEMLTVLTITAILVALAMPQFQSTIRSSRISSATNSIIAALDLARSEAIRRAGVVTVCRSVDSTAPNPSCSSAAANGYAANDWASGWISFAKAPLNLVNTAVEPGDEIILRQESFGGPAGDRMIIESTAPNPQTRSFNSRGLTIGGGAALLFIDHRDSQVPQRTYRARCIELNLTGRSNVAPVDVQNNACPPA
jgi:prepilin-type N-terminal cleavage/methylation domain-containing protein